MAQVFHTKGMGLRSRNRQSKPGVETLGQFQVVHYPRRGFWRSLFLVEDLGTGEVKGAAVSQQTAHNFVKKLVSERGRRSDG